MPLYVENEILLKEKQELEDLLQVNPNDEIIIKYHAIISELLRLRKFANIEGITKEKIIKICNSCGCAIQEDHGCNYTCQYDYDLPRKPGTTKIQKYMVVSKLIEESIE